MLNQNFPFNYKPTDVITTDAGYTIPADKYAFVTVDIEPGESFIVNGTTIMAPEADDIIAVSTGFGLSYVVPAGYTFEGVGRGNTSSVSVGGNPVLGASEFGRIIAGPGQTILAGADGTFAGYAIKKGETGKTANFWLQPDDVITGDARLTVTLYQIP